MNTGICEIRCNVFCLMDGVERIDIAILQCSSQEIQGAAGHRRQHVRRVD